MGRYYELGMTQPAHLIEELQELNLPFRGEGVFRLVQEIETLYLESVFKERHVALAVGLLEKRFSPEILQRGRRHGGPFIKVHCKIPEYLRREE